MDNNNGTTQCVRLLKRLQIGTIDTFTAIRELNIFHLGARISDLRDLGHTIFTHRLVLTDDQGCTHRRMALSALRADSSLSVRLKRYNDHMTIVRALEVQGGAK